MYLCSMLGNALSPCATLGKVVEAVSLRWGQFARSYTVSKRLLEFSTLLRTIIEYGSIGSF
ncbi:hypothetical protein HS7_15630 [Sulfolobales archaeon HS-7]|nr:hypothetical protein HS7_15630 [Sulfolobales archaeon HS-7]